MFRSNLIQLDQGWATSWPNSLNLLKKSNFWTELLNKKCFLGQIGFIRFETNVWKSGSRINWILCLARGPDTKFCLTEICDINLFSTYQCYLSKPICRRKHFLFFILSKNWFFRAILMNLVKKLPTLN